MIKNFEYLVNSLIVKQRKPVVGYILTPIQLKPTRRHTLSLLEPTVENLYVYQFSWANLRQRRP